MMRRILAFIIVASVCSILNIQAQESEKKHEVSFGVGSLANSQILDLVTDLTETTMTAGYVSYDNEKFSIPLSVEYFYHINPISVNILPYAATSFSNASGWRSMCYCRVVIWSANA